MSPGRLAMHIKAALISFAALALVASPAAAQEPQSNQASSEKSAQKKKCRWVTPTGSNRSERICLTAEEWRKVDEYLAKEF
jgi:uncharacterized membrane protein